MTTVCVLQPSYLPWLGYFDQIIRSDIFVFYDDVQFDKHGWRNRNRIKTATGPSWLTVPILHKGLGPQPINMVRLADAGWAAKHIRAVAQSYAKAAYRSDALDLLENALASPPPLLADLDILLIERVCRYLGIKRRFVRVSELGVEGGKTERLVNICRHFGASHYISGDAARDYLDVTAFTAKGVDVIWQDYHHPEYRQLHGAFISHLSIIDLIANLGPASGALLTNTRKSQ